LGAYENPTSDDLRGLVLQISAKDPRTGRAPWIMSNKLRAYLHLLHMAGADEERILQKLRRTYLHRISQ
jgi:type II secretory pathway component PulL